jgi:uncharacterized protein YqgC (DUF456 family)
MAILVLVAILLLSLLMIPFGMPGTLVMVAAAIGYTLLVPGSLSWFTVAGVTVLMIIGEVLEWSLAARFTRRYGGSRRASWGAIIGGMIGAFMGVPVPVVGSILGAFVGSFVGAFVAEVSRGSQGGVATKVATGALVGRVVAAAMKVTIGVVMAAWLLAAAVM